MENVIETIKKTLAKIKKEDYTNNDLNTLSRSIITFNSEFQSKNKEIIEINNTINQIIPKKAYLTLLDKYDLITKTHDGLILDMKFRTDSILEIENQIKKLETKINTQKIEFNKKENELNMNQQILSNKEAEFNNLNETLKEQNKRQQILISSISTAKQKNEDDYNLENKLKLELESLRNKNRELVSENKNINYYTSKISETSNNNDILKAENDIKQNKINEITNENHNLEKRKNELKTNINLISETNKILLETIENTIKKIDIKNKHSNDLENKLQELKNNKKEYKDDNYYEQEIYKLTQENEKLNVKLDSIKKTILELKIQNKNMLNLEYTYNEKLETLKRKNIDLIRLEIEYEQNSQIESNTNLLIENLSSTLKIIKGQVKNKQEKIRNLEDELMNEKQKIKDNDNSYQILIDSLGRLGQATKLVNQIDMKKLNYQNINDYYNAHIMEISKLDEEITKAQLRLEKKQTELLEKTNLNNKISNEILQLDSQIKANKTISVNLNEESLKLKTEVNELEESIKSLSKDVNSTKNHLTAKNLTNTNLKNTLKNLSEKFEEIKIKNKDLKKENKKIKDSIDENNDELNELIENKKILEGRNSSILTSMQFANKDFVDQKQFVDILKEKNQLNFEIETKTNQMSELISQNKNLNNQYEHFSKLWSSAIVLFEKGIKLWYAKNKITYISESANKIITTFFDNLKNVENKLDNELTIAKKNLLTNTQLITKLNNDIKICKALKISKKNKNVNQSNLQKMNEELKTKINEYENIISKKIESSKKISLNDFLAKKKRINNINLPDQNKRKVRILNKYLNNITNVYVDTNTFERLWENPDSAIKEYNDKDYEIFEI